MLSFLDFLKKLFSKKKIHPEVIDDDFPIITEILSWQGNKTDTYNWWPMRETEGVIEDIYNNLYAVGGGLSKYGELFCNKALEYQKTNHFRKCYSSKSDAHWAGFCDSAAILSCLWEYPKYPVIITYNNKTETFTPKDIEALMIVASHNTVDRRKSVFYGERYNGYHFDDKKEPLPSKFLNILKKVCNDNTPFVIDIEHSEAVWNYSYNKVIVNTSTTLPSQFKNKINQIPSTGHTVYYNYIITSDAYSTKNLNLWGWTNRTSNITTEGWLSNNHPDFIWKKYPSKSEWEGKCNINPEVSVKDVYNIYQKSLVGGVLSYPYSI